MDIPSVNTGQHINDNRHFRPHRHSPWLGFTMRPPTQCPPSHSPWLGFTMRPPSVPLQFLQSAMAFSPSDSTTGKQAGRKASWRRCGGGAVWGQQSWSSRQAGVKAGRRDIHSAPRRIRL